MQVALCITWHSDHWSPSPQHIHASCVPIAKGSVQTNISQLPSPHMLFFGGNR